MAKVVEFGIEFTYTPPNSFVKFDLPGNFRVWKGVDFIIDEGDRWIWLEVTNYRYGRLRNKQLSKTKRNKLYIEMLDKFLGTTSFLAHTGKFTCKPLLYVVLIEVPQLDSALKDSLNDRLRKYIPRSEVWKRKIEIGVFDLAKWNKIFPEYSGRRI